MFGFIIHVILSWYLYQQGGHGVWLSGLFAGVALMWLTNSLPTRAIRVALHPVAIVVIFAVAIGASRIWGTHTPNNSELGFMLLMLVCAVGLEMALRQRRK